MPTNLADFNLTGSNDYTDPTGGSQSPGLTNIAGGTGSGPGGGSGASGALGLAGPVLAGGALAYDLFRGNPDSAPVNALKGDAAALGTEAASLATQGQGLQSYLEQGTLPGPQAAGLEMAQNAAKARIIQGAANRGQNTNPLANSGLTQDLNSLSLQTETEKGVLEKQLFDAGQGLIKEGNAALGMEIGIQEKLAAIDAKQQEDTTNAIMGFAKSLGSMDWGKIGTSLASLAPEAAVLAV